MHKGMTGPGTSLSLVKEQRFAGPLHCNDTVLMTLLIGILISGRLSTLGFVYVCVCVAHAFLRVSALRDAMEYCCACDSCAPFFLYLRISALRRWSNSYVLYDAPKQLLPPARLHKRGGIGT